MQHLKNSIFSTIHFMIEPTENQLVKRHQNNQDLHSIDGDDFGVLGYIALIGLANKFANTTERDLCKEIGRVSVDLIEPEFATLDRRNLVERKKFLELELESMRKLKEFSVYEKQFINNGSKALENLGISYDDLIGIGIPLNTLKAARIV